MKITMRIEGRGDDTDMDRMSEEELIAITLVANPKLSMIDGYENAVRKAIYGHREAMRTA